MNGRRAVEGSDGLMGASGKGLGDAQILQGRGRRELPRPGLQDGDRPGQQYEVAGEQAPGVSGAGEHGGRSGIYLVTPFGSFGRRLGQLLITGGRRDADQLGILGRVERDQREDGQALLLAQGTQPSPRLGQVAPGLRLQGQQLCGVPLNRWHAGLQHDGSDRGGDGGLGPVPGVDGRASEGDDAGRVESADDKVSVVGGEASFQRRGGVGQLNHAHRPLAGSGYSLNRSKLRAWTSRVPALITATEVRINGLRREAARTGHALKALPVGGIGRQPVPADVLRTVQGGLHP